MARVASAALRVTERAKGWVASTTTVTRVAHWLHHGEGGYRAALDHAAS